jgi:L-malate glycosyltransferase|tara:strand:+ start:1882 stop:2934 length:1053 start_codon:yes stop_codon:yes gene_type:complete
MRLNLFKRVAIIVPSLSKKGPVIVANSLATKLTECGHYVTLFYLSQGEAELGFSVRTKHLTLGNIKQLYDYDICHSHSFRPDLLLALFSVFKKQNQRIVSTIHNIVHRDLEYDYGAFVSKLVSKIWLFLWDRFDFVISLSEFSQNYYNAFSLNTLVINNGVSVEVNLSELEEQGIDFFSEHSIKIISTSSLSIRKNLDLVLHAVHYDQNLELILVGEGPESDRLKKLSSELNISQRVHFMGFRNNPQAFFRYSDVFVLPSLSEGHPLGLIEAASQGLPCAISRIPETKEFFNESEVAYFQIDNIHEFSKAVKHCFTNSKTFSRALLNKYYSAYTVAKMAESYLEVYNGTD